jgi:diguanylate cyclase (GGDEF)-like protein
MKSINDKFGHKAGDQALIDTANILKATFRKSDIIGRMGGDEFAILAIEASKANIDTINRRLHEFIDIHNKKANRPFELSMSIGISRFYPDSQQTLDDLITQADEQMYLQKRRKKGLQTENIKMESK